MKVLSVIFNTIVIMVLLAAAGLFLTPMLPIANPLALKIVESGSMEPAVMTGALVVIAPASSYEIGDIITFKGSTGNVPTTHRINGIETNDGITRFVTKGDANEEVDTSTILESAVIGKVLVDIPYAGYILDFARQPIGFALLIVLPALMIIFGELEKIWIEVRKRKTPKNNKEDLILRVAPVTSEVAVETRMIEIARPVVIRKLKHFSYQQPVTNTGPQDGVTSWVGYISMFLVSIAFTGMSFTGATVSYFNDTESAVMNFLQAGSLDFNVLIANAGFGLRAAALESSYGELVTVVNPEKGSGHESYSVHIEKKSGSDVLCEAVYVDSKVPVSFSGPLLNLEATDVVFSEPWSITTSLSEDVTGYLETDFCEVDIVYVASAGYTDEERIGKVFYAPALPVISTVLTTFSALPKEIVEIQKKEESNEVEEKTEIETENTETASATESDEEEVKGEEEVREEVIDSVPEVEESDSEDKEKEKVNDEEEIKAEEEKSEEVKEEAEEEEVEVKKEVEVEVVVEKEVDSEAE